MHRIGRTEHRGILTVTASSLALGLGSNLWQGDGTTIIHVALLHGNSCAFGEFDATRLKAACVRRSRVNLGEFDVVIIRGSDLSII